MVIVKIYGGLGNQLFQYSAAYALAQRLKCPLAIDNSFYKKEKLREFQLPYFKIPLEYYCSKKHGSPFAQGLQGLWKKTFLKLKGYPGLPKIQERFFHYNENFMKLKTPVYLDGYWQSERYFKDSEQNLRKILKLKNSTKLSQNPLFDKIVGSNSIAVHIRRSDYTHATNQKIFHTCSLNYYKKAIDFLDQPLQGTHFYLFSDDPIWVKTEFNWLKPKTIVSGNNSLQDFFLMQKAKHHIIANSTYSWWAAWLCNNSEQKVIAPLLWFKGTERNTKDLIPQNWTRL